MGPYSGGQAQFIRVPYADFNALKLPPGKEFEKDFILLADIFPCVYTSVLPDLSSATTELDGVIHRTSAGIPKLMSAIDGVVLSGFKPGESIAVFGAGKIINCGNFPEWHPSHLILGPVGLMAAYR